MAAQTLPALLHRRVQETPQTLGHYVRQGEGQWRGYSWRETGEDVAGLAAGLIRLGVAPGEHIALMAPTSRWWEVAQLAVLMAGGVVVGLDPNETTANVNAICVKAAVGGIIVDTPEVLSRFGKEVRAGFHFAVSLGEDGALPTGCTRRSDLHVNGALGRWEEFDRAEPDNPATVVFTSGTTGPPKGIRYSHKQVVLACQAIVEAFPSLGADTKMVCWLPLSNLFQRMINHCALMINAQVFFVTDPKRIMTFLPEIQPDVFIGVPRFFEKVHAVFLQQVAAQPLPIRLLVRLALLLGRARARKNQGAVAWGVAPLHQGMDALVLKRLRRVFGGELQFMISGSAPMPVWLLEDFRAMGILILEAYGISENVVPMAMNRPEAYAFGTVGKPLDANTIRFTTDNEILVRGPGVCMAYYTEDDTDILLDEKGFLHTGDLGFFDAQGFLVLTGRNSEMIKTSTGRRIAPVLVEERLR
ncbi:MAG: AMP-binding protein, partial [Desulfohalobium sp.]